MDILLENLKAHIEAAVLEKQREHSREYIKKWRTENTDWKLQRYHIYGQIGFPCQRS